MLELAHPAILAAALVAFLSLAGCGTSAPLNRGDEYRLLAYRAVVASVDEVYEGNSELWIKYHGVLDDQDVEQAFHARATWETTGVRGRNASPPPLVLSLEFLVPEEWEARPELTPVSIYDSTHWDELQVRMVEAVTPDEPGRGVVLRSDLDEVLYYRDEAGQINLTRLEKKPPRVRIDRVYSPEELGLLVVTLVEQYLEAIEAEESNALFHTGRHGAGSALFLYADVDSRRAFLLRLDAPADAASGVPFLRIANHILIRSTAAMAISNPFSSVNRLFFLSANNVYDLMHPATYVPEGAVEAPPLSMEPPMDLEAWEKQLDGLSGSTSAMGRLRFLIDGDQFFPRFLEAVLDAERSVDVRIFIFGGDDYAIKVADVLRRKSAEVKVRVMMDGVGTVALAKGGKNLPMPMPDYLRSDSRVKVRVQSSPLLLADHTKSITIDRKLAFVGGMNIGREYRYEWHDLMMEVHGPVVDLVVDEFDKRWYISQFFGDVAYFFHRLRPKRRQQSESADDYPVRVLLTRPGNSQIFRAHRAAAAAARRRIYVQNAYFSDRIFIRDLISARRRGVDVRVILPYRGNHEVMNKSNVITANLFFRNGVRVFFYPGMSHVKAAVFDGWACLGSANFDWLSFRRNLELNLATSHAPAVDALTEDLFLRDFEKSIEMTEPIPENWADHLARIMANRL